MHSFQQSGRALAQEIRNVISKLSTSKSLNKLYSHDITAFAAKGLVCKQLDSSFQALDIGKREDIDRAKVFTIKM